MFYGSHDDHFAEMAQPIHADGTGKAAPSGARSPLLRLSGWENGTVVEEATVRPGRPAALAAACSTRAMLVLVCLDACHALHLSTNDDPARIHAVAEGTIVLLDAQDEHRLAADGDVRIVCFGVETGVLDQLVRRTAEFAVPDTTAIDGRDEAPADAAVLGLATSARAVLRTPSPSSRLFLEQVTFAVAARLLHRLNTVHARLAGGGRLAPWQLAKVKRMVSVNLGRTLQAHELAETCGLSPSHFSRAFRCSTGTSPHAWVTSRRIARAKDLMRGSDAQLAEIALDCGFADQSHFTRVFTREEGVSPGSWRRNLSPEETRAARASAAARRSPATALPAAA